MPLNLTHFDLALLVLKESVLPAKSEPSQQSLNGQRAWDRQRGRKAPHDALSPLMCGIGMDMSAG